MQRRPENPLADRLLAAQRELSALSAASGAVQDFESPDQPGILVAPQFAPPTFSAPGFARHTSAPAAPVVVLRRRRVVVPAGALADPQQPSSETEVRSETHRSPRVFVRPASDSLLAPLEDVASAEQPAVVLPAIADGANAVAHEVDVPPWHDERSPAAAPTIAPRRRRRHPADHLPSAVTVIKPAEGAPPIDAQIRAEIPTDSPAAATSDRGGFTIEVMPAGLEREMENLDSLLRSLAADRPVFQVDLTINERWGGVLRDLEALEATMALEHPWRE